MKDIIYAGFAQLSYLNWHNLNTSNSLITIFNTKQLFDQIKTPDYDKMETDGQDYYVRLENKKKIYDGKDGRLFFLYSEHREAPNANPKYPEFGDWEFVQGYNHWSIYQKMKGTMTQTFDYTSKAYKSKEIKEISGEINSGFQASVFKKNNDIMIAYRGTDEIVSDFSRANIPSGTDFVTDQMSCAIFVYEDIVKKYLKPGVSLHITGHSLGGSLAQYTAIYSKAKHSTICWNGLGLGNANISAKNKEKERHQKIFKNNYSYCLNSKKIRNYSFSKDLVGNLFKKVGDTFIVDKEKSLVTEREFYLHSIFNFLPFFDGNGNINRDRHLSNNFLMNSFKCFAQERKDLLPKIKKGQSGIKMGEMYKYVSTAHNYKNPLFHCIERSFKREDDRWYNPSVPEIGLFNNIASIAGVSGGEPYPLHSAEKKKILRNSVKY